MLENLPIKSTLSLAVKIEDNKYKASVLLFNIAMQKDVYNSDYGEKGLSLITAYDAYISGLKLSKNKKAERFNFTMHSDTNSNAIRVNMGDMVSKSLIEFEFYINKKNETLKHSGIILPHDISIKSKFTKAPSISLIYDRSNLTIRQVKYNILNQFFHWFLAFFTIVLHIAFIWLIAHSLMFFLLLKLYRI
jgi:hypothetical protein